MYLDRMNYPEVEEYLKAGDTVLLVTGSTENHGKHMPLGTDTMIPQKIADLVEGMIPALIVTAPPLPYGSTEDLRSFPGTLSLGVDGLTLVLGRICDQLFDFGFRHFVVLNGHGGNSKAIEAVGQQVYKRGGLLARADWWLIAPQLDPAWKGGHGGGEETAGVMAVDPELIKREWLKTGENMRNDLGEELPYYSWTQVAFEGASVTVPRPLRSVTDNGWVSYGLPDAPTRADEAWGKKMLETTAEWLARFIPVFSRAPLPGQK